VVKYGNEIGILVDGSKSRTKASEMCILRSLDKYNPKWVNNKKQRCMGKKVMAHNLQKIIYNRGLEEEPYKKHEH
jgi:hypothetical protein